MIEFIPIYFYKSYYYFILLFIVIVVLINSKTNNINDKINLNKFNLLGFFLAVFLTLFIGLRPINGKYFGDTGTYGELYKAYSQNIYHHSKSGDFLFDFLMNLFSKFTDINFFLLLCSSTYVFSIYFATKKIFKEYWFYAFIMIVGSLSFWSYGVNGVRNGMATSLFIFALSRKNVRIQILWMLIALGFHKSLILPIVGYLLTLKFNTPRLFLIFWFFCIPFSLLIGSSFQNLISSFFEDDKLNSYFYDDSFNKQFTKIGFRWDFLLYSSLGVFTGLYFIVRRKYTDLFYSKIFSIYLFSNAMWILVINASFSNRFAYLSWFMLGLIIVYPFFKQFFFSNQYKVFGNVLFFYFLITFILDFILVPN